MLEDRAYEWYGFALLRASGLPSGVAYPTLARLEREGWLVSRWESESPSDLGRPRRRLYRMAPDYLADIEAVVERHLPSEGKRISPALKPREESA